MIHSDIGYFVEIGLNYPDKTKEKTKKIQFAPENKINPKEKYIDYVKNIQPKK